MRAFSTEQRIPVFGARRSGAWQWTCPWKHIVSSGASVASAQPQPVSASAMARHGHSHRRPSAHSPADDECGDYRYSLVHAFPAVCSMALTALSRMAAFREDGIISASVLVQGHERPE